MMRFDRFTERAQDAAARAYEILQRYGHNQVDTEHILLALLEQPEGVIPQILDKISVDQELIKKRLDDVLRASPKAAIYGGGANQVFITPRVKRIIDLANEEANRLKDEYISTEHIFLAILTERNTPAARILESAGLTRDRVYTAIQDLRGGQRVTDPQAESRYRTLEKYSRDLTQLAREGKLDPVIGRDNEILRLIQILSRRTKNNPALIGEAGVGKTAIAEGLAQLITLRNVPESLLNKRVLTLDVGALVAGTKYRGEFEERLRRILEEIRSSKEVVLFMDELHTLVGAGAAQGAIDAATMLKPALARGEIQCIGATTLNEYRKYIEKDAALERRFQPVFVDQPTILETIEILHGVKSLYERHHRVTITDAAVRAAVVMSDRYVADRALPDKAIDLIDEGSARVRLKLTTTPDELKDLKKEIKRLQVEKEDANARLDYETAASVRDKEMKLKEKYAQKESTWRDKLGETVPEVGEEDIAEMVAAWTGVPVSRLVEEETSRLLRMEQELHKRLVGQDEAIVAVSQAVRRARAGLKDPRRPIGSFIFLGPTGIGKTELARALAEYMFDSEDALIKLDMSEFMERHTTARLVGSPPGYVGYEEGGQLTEAVRRRPYSVILLDEIEK